MRAALRTIIEPFGACWALFRLAWQTRFRLRGRYWRWRHETAFSGGAPTASEKRRATLHYARWVWRMGRHL